MERPILKNHLEKELGEKAIEKEFEPKIPEPFLGANQSVKDTLKENFEIDGVNPIIDIEIIDKIVVDFYESNDYNFDGFGEKLRGPISNSKYKFSKGGDRTLVHITYTNGLVLGSVHYLN